MCTAVEHGSVGQSDPRTRSGGDRRREAPSAVTQMNPETLWEPQEECSFLCEGPGSLDFLPD